MNTINMALDKKLVVFLSTSVLMICDLLLFTSAQTFTEQPQSFIGLKPDDNSLTDLECAYTTQNADDVIGWVVNDVRISNGNVKISEAITSVLGSEAITQLQPSLSGNVYGLVFFSVTPVVAGDYRCQLCTNDGNNGCGTVLIESDVSQVQVEYEPTETPICLPTSSTTRVVLGEAVMLSCASEPGLPVVELEWLRNSAVISGQPEPVVMNGVLYNNFSYTPDVSDIGAQLTCRMQSASNSLSLNCQSPTFNIVSTPNVVVFPPDPNQVPVGSEAVYTCQATSETNTPIETYGWLVEDIPASRYTASGNTLTIASVTVIDHGKTIQCEATDEENMKGMGERVILVAGEVVPSNLPTVPTRPIITDIPGTSATTEAPAGINPAVIIAISVVAVILLCILIVAGVWFFCKNKKKQKQQKHIPPTVVKNNLSPTSASPFHAEKAFTYPHDDPRNPDPDVIPKGMNERPVDVKGQWRDSGPAEEYSPTIKSVNMPFQSQGSRTALDQESYNYNPTYDDKVDPADLDFKPPLDDRDYSDSGYRDGDNLYPDEKYGKGYGDRQFGDGHQDPYVQDYGDSYGGDRGDYGRVYDDDYQSQPAHYDTGYDAYPDRMPDGSEGYDPAPEEYNAPPADGYTDPRDYGHVSDYGVPAEYSSNPVNDYGYDGQPDAHSNKPSEYDYQPSNSDNPPVDDYDQQSYHAAPYDDQYNQPGYDSQYPDRVPDGGAPENDGYDYSYQPENEPYNDGGYGNYGSHDDGANYSSHPAEHDSYAPSYQEPYHSPGQSHHSEPYLELEDVVSATSNPSYV